MKKDVSTQIKSFWKQYLNCFKLDTKSIARNAIIAALYTALTYAFWFCSYGPVQVRISEFMVLLVFFNPNYIYGLTLGCILSNIYSVGFSSFCSPLDILIGTLATIIACLAISLSKRLLIASIFPAITNGLLLAWEFSFVANNYSPVYFFTNAGYVALGEVIAVTIIGYLLFVVMKKKIKNFDMIFCVKQNSSFKW